MVLINTFTFVAYILYYFLVPDGDDDIRPGSPAGKSIPSLSAPLPHNPSFIRHNINHNPPFLAQTVGVPGQAPSSQIGSHTFSTSFRG